MNEKLDESDASADGAEHAPRAVPDNYERYLRDEYGYEYGARDILSMRTLESHDRLRDDPRGELEERSLDDLDDFELLGLARGLLDDGDLEGFAGIVDRLISSEEDHDGVRYPEIPLLGARVALDHGAHERALGWLERGTERWPESSRPAGLLRARLALHRDDPERAATIHRELADDHPDDPELAFEIAEDLVDEGVDARAAEWIDRAREVAARVGDEAITVDLDVLEDRLADD